MHTQAHPGWAPSASNSTVWNWLPSALLWAVIFISFRPFAKAAATSGAPGAAAAGGGGDIVNQLGFAGIGAICLYLLSSRKRLGMSTALLTLSWCAAAVVLAMSVVIADHPPSAVRAMIFSLIVVLAAFSAMALLRSKDDLVSALAGMVGLVLFFCYFAVLFVPEKGIHDGSGFEAGHGGLWLGVFDHKNIASYVMGGMFIVSLFLIGNGRPRLGIIAAVLSLFFVMQAGSKTVLGVLPAAIVAVAIANWVTWSFLRLVIVMLPLSLLVFSTLGAVIYEPILQQLRVYIPGLSYTGRTDLWIFGIEHLLRSPFVGYGFESFWSTPRVTALEQPIELNWDVRGIVHGHNSWLDAAVAFGIPGATLMLMMLVILPLRDYLAIPQAGNAGKIAGFFMTLWLFSALAANLESFFFRRADPVWFLMLIAIIGLRLTAHMTRPSRYA
ncbi:MAG: O-antigen ligase [Ahrensia sp.]|nr:O-antigen ligase [Ahrensia sp.]